MRTLLGIFSLIAASPALAGEADLLVRRAR